MKKHVVLLLMMASAVIWGQELQNVLPQSPEAASIGKYGQVPVGLFTGTPQLSVPIYQFTSGALNVPVSVNYSSNGIRVDEFSSSVGLGWNLAAGGVITRAVFGQKDENTYITPNNTNLDYSVDQYNFVSAATGPGNNAVDTQPDIFSFNFNGFTGKFHLGDNSSSMYSRNVVFLEPSPLKVKLLSVNGETHFRITDPNGIQYYFGGVNAIEKFRYRTNNRADNPEVIEDVASAWYLTKITHPFGEEITFSYQEGSVSYTNGIGQSISKANSITNYGVAPRFCDIPSNENAYLNLAYGNFCYLTNIQSSNAGEIAFVYSQKNHMPTGFKQLDQVVISDQQGVLVKSFDLGYQVANSSGHANNDINAETYYGKRYFLSTVTEVAKTGEQLTPHSFTYNDPEGLPSRFSYAQDYWGYYNGKHLNENLIDQKTIDAVSTNLIIANGLSGFKPADRATDPLFAVKGMLQNVTYPLKGSNEFAYEGNAYYGEVISYPPLTNATATVSQGGLLMNDFEIAAVDFDHKAYLSFTANLDDFFTQEGSTTVNEDFNIAQIEVYDLTAGTVQPVYAEADVYGFNPFMTPYGVNSTNFSNSMYVNLEQGHAYRFAIQLDPGYSMSGISLRYYDAPMVITQENIPVGGMRIQQITTENSEGKSEVKKYHYGTMDCMDCDSGSIFNRNLRPTVMNSKVLFCRTNSSGNVGNNNGGHGDTGGGPDSQTDGNSSGGSSGSGNTGGSNTSGNTGGSGSSGSSGNSNTSGGSGDSNNSGGSGSSNNSNNNGNSNSSNNSNNNNNNNNNNNSGNTGGTGGSNSDFTCNSPGECGYTTITANTLFSLYAQGYHIGYSSVIEELGNDFKAGAVNHEFEGGFLIEPAITIQGDYIAGIPFSNFFGFGRNKGATTYTKKGNQFQKVSETKNNYSQNSILDKNTSVYLVRRETEIKEGFSYADNANRTFENSLYAIGQYALKRQWHTLSERITKQYDNNGENPVTTTQKFFYDNEQHLQQTRSETIDSKGKLLKTQTIYPQDIAVANRTAAEQLLIDQHRIATPIEVITSEKEGANPDRVLSKVYTQHKIWNTNKVLPEKVRTANWDNDFEDRVKYTSYDGFGNPTEMAKEDGTSMAYIWGYNHQYPVAKIENMTYSGVSAYVNTIQSKSDLDTDHKMGGQGTEGALRTELNKLRTELPTDAMVTTYTYDPMVGVTSMTDPRGYTVYYEYDEFNRLQYVRDADGNLISENKYHYKN